MAGVTSASRHTTMFTFHLVKVVWQAVDVGFRFTAQVRLRVPVSVLLALSETAPHSNGYHGRDIPTHDVSQSLRIQDTYPTARATTSRRTCSASTGTIFPSGTRAISPAARLGVGALPLPLPLLRPTGRPRSRSSLSLSSFCTWAPRSASELACADGGRQTTCRQVLGHMAAPPSAAVAVFGSLPEKTEQFISKT